MPNMVDLYTPRTLAEVVKTTPPVRTFLRDRFFTNVKTFPTKRVDIDIVKGNRKMAAFIHPMVGGEIVQAEGYETKSYAPPLINPATISTADQLLERLPGEDMYSGKTPADRAAEKLIEEYNQLNDMTTRREEWMAAQVLTTGQLKVKGKGVDEVIDFGLTNKTTLASTKKWGGSAADIWGNLKDWKQQVSRNGFANANMVIMGKAAADAFLADATIKNLLDNRRIEIGAIKPEEMEGGLTYYGHLNLPGVDIYGYDEVYLDDADDSTKPLIPDNMVLMLPSAAGFVRAYGLCTYLDDAGAWHSAETDRLLRTYVEHRPDRRFIELQTHPLLIPDRDKALPPSRCGGSPHAEGAEGQTNGENRAPHGMWRTRSYGRVKGWLGWI